MGPHTCPVAASCSENDPVAACKWSSALASLAIKVLEMAPINRLQENWWRSLLWQRERGRSEVDIAAVVRQYFHLHLSGHSRRIYTFNVVVPRYKATFFDIFRFQYNLAIDVLLHRRAHYVNNVCGILFVDRSACESESGAITNDAASLKCH